MTNPSDKPKEPINTRIKLEGTWYVTEELFSALREENQRFRETAEAYLASLFGMNSNPVEALKNLREALAAGEESKK